MLTIWNVNTAVRARIYGSGATLFARARALSGLNRCTKL